VRFVNSGIGGDTAQMGLARIDRDVFAHQPTALVVMFGLNDIGWGAWADAEHKGKHLSAIGQILDRCREKNVRVYICSGPVTSEDPEKSEQGFLQQMCDEAMALARDKGEASIDVQRYMRGVQRRVAAYNKQFIKDQEKHVKLHAADGVHLNDLGHLAVAVAMLKGWHAPAEVSAATIDAAEGKAIETSGCQVSDVEKAADGVSFTRLDGGLPFNSGLFYALNFAYVPVHQELNGYTLAVRGLPAGKYSLTVDGRGVSAYTAAQLAGGVNIASVTTSAWAPGGPWDAQASLVKSLTDSRHSAQTAALLATLYLPGHATTAALHSQIDVADREITQLQRLAAAPQPYRFVLKRME
jgi:lysophospholipase L1-like esterase